MVLQDGIYLTFGRDLKIKPYCTEIFVSLNVLIFINHYSKFYELNVINQISATYDNESCVNLLTNLVRHKYYQQGLFTSSKTEVYVAIICYQITTNTEGSLIND